MTTAIKVNKTTVRIPTKEKDQLKIIAIQAGIDLEDVVSIMAKDFITNTSKDLNLIQSLKNRIKENQ